MIENLQDELYQLENKQAKGAKLRANIRSWRAKNGPKTFFEVLERQNNIAKFLTERKYLMNTLIFVRLKYL